MIIWFVSLFRSGYMSTENVKKRQAEWAKEREIKCQECLRRKEERKRKEEEEEGLKRQRKAERTLRRQKKAEQKEAIITKLKDISQQRHKEAQRLLRVLLAGAAEVAYQEQQKQEIAYKRNKMKKLKQRVEALESSRKNVESELHAKRHRH